MKRRFGGSSVVITGGAGGIGTALAHSFARAGANIAILDLPQSPLEVVCDEVAAHGGNVVAVTCDVTDRTMCEKAMQTVQRELGGIDVLINNAGAVHRSQFVDTDADVIQRVFEVNVFGSLNCTKAAQPSLLESKGLIIVISSVAGLAPVAGRAGYVGSKHALHGLFESAAAELRPSGVDVLMVCPTFTASGFEAAAMGADGKPANQPRSKIGSLAQPEEVADAVLRAAQRGQRRLILSPMGRAAALLSRIAPRVYEHMMLRGLK